MACSLFARWMREMNEKLSTRQVHFIVCVNDQLDLEHMNDFLHCSCNVEGPFVWETTPSSF